MKQITAYTTYDSRIHETQGEAKSYLRKRYEELLNDLACTLYESSGEGVALIKEEIERNLYRFAELKTIENDGIVELSINKH